MIETLGLRHVALRVADLARAKRFYCENFGMHVTWQPDPDNAYLSSGCDILALHREPTTADTPQSRLDHIGFFVSDQARLEEDFAWAQRQGLPIVHPLRHHRDGTSSFYLRDPDGVVIQVLYDPSLKSAPGGTPHSER
ncbi:MAG TPA: VOC family protein [Candidatus Binataceae bacterium]|nr:VOC family protein [Candidatus Binataceae bacterium]